jgi:S-phase kinase-associated protein 1
MSSTDQTMTDIISLDETEEKLVDQPIVLISKDGIEVSTTRKVVNLSGMINAAIETDTECKELPLGLVDADELKYSIEYLQWLTTNKASTIPYGITDTTLKSYLQEWELQFIDKVYSNKMLAKLTNAANYLDIKPLLEICCAKIASLIKGKIYDNNIDQIIASL